MSRAIHSTDPQFGIPVPPGGALPRLVAGDRLDQPTFQARYEAMPEKTRAELIEGVVAMMSPIKRPHGRPLALLGFCLGLYEEPTPGVEHLGPVTFIVDEDNQVEPDLVMIRKAAAGGAARFNADEYLIGSPDLVIEVANTSSEHDLRTKKRIYQRAGVKEYVVAVVRGQQLLWFVNDGGEFQELSADADGIHRSRVFPGLWLNSAALWAEDVGGLRATMQAGIATPEHAAFTTLLGKK